VTRNVPIIALAVLALPFLGAKCNDPSGPVVSVTLHAVEDDLNDLLVIPQETDLFVNASVVAGASRRSGKPAGDDRPGLARSPCLESLSSRPAEASPFRRGAFRKAPTQYWRG
jgi:hypothetical protein